MPDFAWIKEELNKRHIPDVCRATGLSDPTIRAIASGENDNPRLKTIEAIAKYLISTGA